MTDLYGLLIDLNDGLYDEGGTRAQDALRELRPLTGAVGASDHGWFACYGTHSILSGPDRTEVYAHTHACTIYPPEQTDEAICHFCRLVSGNH